MKVKRGEVWRADVPFNDDPAQAKYRPVVVIGWSKVGPDQDSVILVVPITTFGDGARPREGDVEVPDPKACGLNKRGWVRARRVWGADPAALDLQTGPTGSVSPQVMAQILIEIEKLFSV